MAAEHIKKTGKQAAKREAAHEKICQATIQSLAELGYAETSIHKVIERAGVSKGALQHHFPTKEDLMAATAKRILENALFVPAFGTNKPASKRDVAEELKQIWLRYVNTKEYRALLEVLIAIRTDTELQIRLSPQLKTWEEKRLKHARNQYEAKSGDDADISMLITMTTSMMRGLIIQAQYNNDPEFHIRIIDFWTTMAASLLKPRINPRENSH